jgi:hypothetical protein
VDGHQAQRPVQQQRALVLVGRAVPLGQPPDPPEEPLAQQQPDRHRRDHVRGEDDVVERAQPLGALPAGVGHHDREQQHDQRAAQVGQAGGRGDQDPGPAGDLRPGVAGTAVDQAPEGPEQGRAAAHSRPFCRFCPHERAE